MNNYLVLNIMSKKKEFSGDMKGLLGNSKPVEIKKEKEQEQVQKLQEVTPLNKLKPVEKKYIRSTFMVDNDLLQKIKYAAWYERKQIKDIVNESFQEYIKNFEKEYSTIDELIKDKS